MRRPDARSTQIGGPDCILIAFQVSAYSGEPFVAKRATNLFSKDNCRAALGDEAVKSGPEVSLIGMAFALSRARNRLTRTGAGPDGSSIGPAGEAQGVGPSADTGEEMALRVASDVIGLHLLNVALIDVAGCDQPIGDQLAQPRRGKGIVFVVIDRHDVPARS